MKNANIIEKKAIAARLEPGLIENLSSPVSGRPFPVIWSLDDQWEDIMQQPENEQPFPVVWSLDDQWDGAEN